MVDENRSFMTKNVKFIFNLIGDVHRQECKNLGGGNGVFINEITAKCLRVITSTRRKILIWWHKHVR